MISIDLEQLVLIDKEAEKCLRSEVVSDSEIIRVCEGEYEAVHYLIDRCFECGVYYKDDIVGYISLYYQAGSDFFSLSKVVECMNDSLRSGPEKIEVVYRLFKEYMEG